MINVLLFVLIFCLSYLMAFKIHVFLKSDKYKKKSTIVHITKADSIKTLFSKINFINAKENFLSKQGYPLKLNAISYYLCKVLFGTILFIVATINYNSEHIGAIMGTIGFFFIDVYICINKKTRDSEICTDLLNVVDSIILQLSAEITLKDSLKKQFDNCQNKDFKKAMLEFAMKYEMSELNIHESLSGLENKFDILEINMFCNSLREYNKTGDIIEILENLSKTLNVKYLEKVKGVTRTKIIYITTGVVIALGNIVMMTFYPLFISIGQGFNTIFN